MGSSSPFRLDRNSFGGGLLIYVRSDIPCKLVHDYPFSDNIEGIFYRNQFSEIKVVFFKFFLCIFLSRDGDNPRRVN